MIPKTSNNQKRVRKIPSDRLIDSTIPLVLEGYRFIPRRCERYHTEIFQGRVFLEKTIFFRGASAAQVFYDTAKFDRKGAAPKRIQKTLTGEGGVQGLDGEAHRQRKQLFMALMTPQGQANCFPQGTVLLYSCYTLALIVMRL